MQRGGAHTTHCPEHTKVNCQPALPAFLHTHWKPTDDHPSITSPTDHGATHMRLTHPSSWLLACAAGLALTACGGGSGNEGGAGDPGPGGTASSGVFIAPSGPLCTKLSSTGSCLQPTSSAIEESDLIKLITDPDAQTSLIDFSGMGVIHNTTLTYSQQPGRPSKAVSFTAPTAWQARLPGRNTLSCRAGSTRKSRTTGGPEPLQEHQRRCSVIFLVGPPDQHEGIWGTTSRKARTSAGRPHAQHAENTNSISAIDQLTDQSQAPSEADHIGRPLAGTAQLLDLHTTTY